MIAGCHARKTNKRKGKEVAMKKHPHAVALVSIALALFFAGCASTYWQHPATGQVIECQTQDPYAMGTATDLTNPNRPAVPNGLIGRALCEDTLKEAGYSKIQHDDGKAMWERAREQAQRGTR